MTESIDLRLRYKMTEGDVLIRGRNGAINESIRNILGTTLGTRLFNRSFGGKIQSLLFEPLTLSNARTLLIEIERMIRRFEPRVSLLIGQSEVVPDYDNNGYEIRLVYDVVNREESGEFNAFLVSESK